MVGPSVNWLEMVIMMSHEQMFCCTMSMVRYDGTLRRYATTVRYDRNDQRMPQSHPGGGPLPGSYHTRVPEYQDTSRAAGDAALAAYADCTAGWSGNCLPTLQPVAQLRL